ncbi:hypothetical protein RQP46_003823 [Phenoliferia psychrophenolica]
MLEIGTSHSESEIPEVGLEETSAVLAIVLPFTEPHPVGPFVLEFPRTFAVIKAMDKYEIWRGLDAIRLAFCHAYMGTGVTFNRTLLTFEEDVYAYLFASHIQDGQLREVALKRIIDAEPTLEDLLKMSNKLQGYFKGDASRVLVDSFVKFQLRMREVFYEVGDTQKAGLHTMHSYGSD